MVRDLGSGFGRFFRCELKSFSKIDQVIESGGVRVLVFEERSEVDWPVCKHLAPEDWWEVRDVPLGLETLHGSLDVGSVGIAEEMCFV